MGDLNAIIGKYNTDKEEIREREGVRIRTENEFFFVDICATNNLTIGGSKLLRLK